MGRDITAVSRLAGGHSRKKILSGALTGQNFFSVLTWLGFLGTPSAGHLIPPSRRSANPIRRRHHIPPRPRRAAIQSIGDTAFQPSPPPRSSGPPSASKPTSRTARRPGVPRQGFSRAGPLAWASV